MRDSVVQCELLLLRQLNFYVSFEHPHKVRLSTCLCLPVFVWSLCVGSGYCLVLSGCVRVRSCCLVSISVLTRLQCIKLQTFREHNMVLLGTR